MHKVAYRANHDLHIIVKSLCTLISVQDGKRSFVVINRKGPNDVVLLRNERGEKDKRKEVVYRLISESAGIWVCAGLGKIKQNQPFIIQRQLKSLKITTEVGQVRKCEPGYINGRKKRVTF